MAKKSNKSLGRGKPVTLKAEAEIITGAIIIDSQAAVEEELERMEAAQEAVKPILDYIERARSAATDYANTHNVKTIQLDGRYWRRIQRHSPFWIGTKDDIPEGAPKGAKSLKEICGSRSVKLKSGKRVKLWNFITKRIPSPDLIDAAVRKGYLTEKEVGKAFFEKPQRPYLQKFNGEAYDDE